MSSFEVIRKDNIDVSVLYLKGYLDAHTYPNFENELQKLVDERRYKIIVDFQDLNYISSAGLGVFMGFIETVRDNQGDIKLCSMSPKVFKVFDLLGFPTIYQIVKNPDEAHEKFERGDKTA
ncbi:MAG: STAS domain-containing protein [Bacteroidetes bacterium]|nr:STAS domain-containing protein [Bacteroidota bacterium]